MAPLPPGWLYGATREWFCCGYRVTPSWPASTTAQTDREFQSNCGQYISLELQHHFHGNPHWDPNERSLQVPQQGAVSHGYLRHLGEPLLSDQDVSLCKF